MDEFSNGLTPAELERLSLLSEECAEVIQIVQKIQRHGYASHHPFEVGPDNRGMLEIELGHVYYAIWLLIEADDVNMTAIACHENQKSRDVEKWLHHQSSSPAES